MKTLIQNIGLLATPRGTSPQSGRGQGDLMRLENAWIAVDEGRIHAVGSAESLPADFSPDEIVDAGGRLVTPGLVDAHTHLVFGGWRQHELGMKLKGASYLDILAAGGGILSTVKATREASEDALLEKTKKLLWDMLHLGTTTIEAKSGYGLDLETELKQLRVIQRAGEETPLQLVPTFMGAHAVPAEYKENREGYLHRLIEEIIPAIGQSGLAKFCDVFCEEGVFSAQEAGDILEAGKKAGLRPKIHADEIMSIGGTKVAKETGAISAEHLIQTEEAGIFDLKEGGVIACLLPCTSLYLGASFARARAMIEAGVPVAFGSDLNPGSCPSGNLQLVMNIAALYYKMTPEEVLTGATLNGACAIGLGDEIGTLEKGKAADLVIWEAPDLNYLCYRMGSNLVHSVMKRGVIYG